MCGMIGGLLGGVLSAVGTLYQASAQSAAYKADAEAKKMEARGLAEEGSYAARRQQDENARLTGDQVAAYAGAGVDPTYGTAADVVTDSRREGEMDVQAIRRNAEFQASTRRYAAKIDIMNARNAKIGGFIGALAPVLSGLRTSFG